MTIQSKVISHIDNYQQKLMTSRISLLAIKK